MASRLKRSWFSRNKEALLKLVLPVTVIAVLSTSLVFTAARRPLQQEIEASQSNSTMTAYCYSAEEWKNLTAIGATAKVGWTVAASPDRFDLLGKKIYIKGLGVKEVTDVMHTGNKNSIDIYVSTQKEAKEFGKKEVEVVVIK